MAIIGASGAAHHIGLEGAIMNGITLGTVRRFFSSAALITVKRTCSALLRSLHVLGLTAANVALWFFSHIRFLEQFILLR